MKVFGSFSKVFNSRKTLMVSSVVCASIVLSGIGITVTEAALTDSAPVTVANKAEIWIVPSVSPAASDFQSATVNWTKAGTYTTYTLQYSTSSSFATVTTLTVTGLTKTISGLKSNTTYYFRVAPSTSPTGTWKTASVLIPAWNGTVVGTGWGPYTPIVAGDLNKDGDRDLDVLSTSNGVLYLYPGYNTGAVSSTGKIQIGTGWLIYDTISGAGDFNTDGREDLLAIDASGVLWLYTAKATWSTDPYNTRVQIGVGWQGLWGVKGVGDVTGDGYADIAGVDSNNVLRIYPGTGAGGFKPVILTTSPFANYFSFTTIGDLNKDGKNDLIAMDAAGQAWFLAGNGVSTTSIFKTAVKIPNLVFDTGSEFVGPGDMNSDGFSDLEEVDSAGNLVFWSGADMATALGL